MVKLNGVKDRKDSAPTSSGGSLICFICGATNANWPVYCRSRNSEKMPYFPFLEYHDPAEGANPMDNETGRVDSCTVCFSFLTQQWHAFEANETPVIKRIYWLKRSGPDTSGDRAASPQVNCHLKGEQSIFEDFNAITGHDNQATEVRSEKCTDARREYSGGSYTGIVSATDDTNEIYEDTAGNLVGHISLNSVSRRSGGLETCYICSRRKPKEFMRSVHTRPQLKTETPFYPCLSRHPAPITARQMDYLGKVLVCEACQKFLFRQWQVFQKNSTPLAERQYQLRSDPSLPREQQSHLSTMVCYICGVTQPATSGRFLYSRKHAPGHPYYPFLNNLPTPEGAMPLTKQGLTRACSGCRKSLIRQWKQFEAMGIAEGIREYRIRNEVVVQPEGNIIESLETRNKIACYICGQQCSESDLQPVYSKANSNTLNSNFYFPFLVLLKPPNGCQPLDSEGQTVICKKCNEQLRIEWEEFEKLNTPPEKRSYLQKMTYLLAEDAEGLSVCFLCGVSMSGSLNFKLYSYPHSGKGIHDGGPFFPFLSSQEPAPKAQPMDSEGTIVTCEICYSNLMRQWNAYEESDIPGDSNRWLRKYVVMSVYCYLCCKQVSRSSCGAVNRRLISFPSSHQPPKTGILINNGNDVVLCSNCQTKVQRELEATEDSSNVTGVRQLQEQENQESVEVPQISELGSTSTKYTKGHLDVINSNEDSEKGDGSVQLLSQSRNQRLKLNTSLQSSNASSMHYTTSLSPGLQPVLHNKESNPSSTDTSMSGGGPASFAAALRKLAKQAKPVPSSSSSPPPPEKRSQSVSPVVSAVRTGMSPSQTTSPLAGQSDHDASTTKERGDHHSPGVIAIRTPPVPNITPLDPDHRNPRPGSEQSRDSNRGPLQRTEANHPLIGHEVMPGVFSSVPREVPMLSEHYPSEPPHAPVAFYPAAYGAKPDLPLYLPRGGHPTGPPPLLASKRDGPDSHMLPAFYPTPYPPPVMEPPDMHFSTWRQQRAAEHLRQQHERHSMLPDGTIVVEPFEFPVGHVSDAARQLPPGGIENFLRKNSPHLRSADNSESRETRKQETRESVKMDKETELVPKEQKRSSVEGPPHRGINQEHKQGSCPVHGHGTTPGLPPTSSSSEPPGSQGAHSRADTAMISNIARPGEYKRMFLPAHEVPMIHPYLVHPPRDAPYPIHPLDERHAEFVRGRERQEFLLHERLMFEQKGLRTAGEDWQRHHLQQDKPAGLGVLHYPQPVHQQGPLESSKSPHSIDRHKGEPSLARLMPGREAGHLYRGFPYHSFHHPPSEGKGFSDHYEPDFRHPHSENMRRSTGGASERVGVPYLEPKTFGHKGFQHSAARIDSGKVDEEREWQQRDRNAIVNGDYHQDKQRTMSSERSSPSLAKRIKIERCPEEASMKQINKIRHDPSKLVFLEGLGLVTADRKKEISQRGPTLKRKFSDDQRVENCVESTNNLVTDENCIGDHKNDDSDLSAEAQFACPEKLDFMAKLGLLPPSKRQELEQSYEMKRNERKNRKSRGRPPKRARRDKENDRDSDNSQGSLEREGITGPITRQKQQLLQEQEKKENRIKDTEKTHLVSIKTEEGEKRTSSYPFHNRIFRRSSNERYQQSSDMGATTNHLPPRLTLQSLTNMEDPFSNISASEFRPPYLRHTGLLSVSHEHGTIVPHARQDHRTQPIRPEPLRSTGISLSEKETRDYLSQCSSGIQGHPFGPLPLVEKGGSRNKQVVSPIIKDGQSKSSRERDTYKWSGVEAVMQSYYIHAAERGVEICVLQDNAELLKSRNVSLNEEAQALSLQMTNLVQAKKELVEERNSLRQGLDRLHFFIESLKR